MTEGNVSTHEPAVGDRVRYETVEDVEVGEDSEHSAYVIYGGTIVALSGEDETVDVQWDHAGVTTERWPAISKAELQDGRWWLEISNWG